MKIGIHQAVNEPIVPMCYLLDPKHVSSHLMSSITSLETVQWFGQRIFHCRICLTVEW